MKFTRFRAFVLALAFAIATPAIAYAATAIVSDPVAATDAGALFGSSKVTIPWGAYVSGVLTWAQEIVVTVAVGAVAYFSRSLPAWAAAFIADRFSQQKIERAVHYGITQIEGAVAGKALDVQATNALVAMAQQYVLSMAPQVAASLGDRLKPRILAEIGKLGVAPQQIVPAPLPAPSASGPKLPK